MRVEVRMNAEIEYRLAELEKTVKRLEARVKSEHTAPILDRGMTYFSEGDPIPSRGSVAEYQEGKIWIIDGQPLAFVKNDSGRSLQKGDKLKGGTVDSQLRFEVVSPNNFCYIEI